MQPLTSDPYHPLIRDRKILVETFDQLTQLIGFFEDAGWNTNALEADLRRVHLRLIQKQQEIETYDAD